MLNCKELSEQASDYIDKNLSFLDRMQIRFHLVMCKHCHRFVEQLALTMNATKALKPKPASEQDIEKQINKMLIEKNSKTP